MGDQELRPEDFLWAEDLDKVREVITAPPEGVELSPIMRRGRLRGFRIRSIIGKPGSGEGEVENRP